MMVFPFAALGRHMRLKEPFFLSLIFIGAFILRMAYLNQIENAPFFYPLEGSDQFLYHSWAEDIASGKWFGKEIFYAMPLYPYFLSLIYMVFGQSVYMAKLLQMIMGSLGCTVVYAIGKRTFNKAVGLIASGTAAVYLMFIFYEEILVPVSLVIFLNLLLLLFLLSVQEKPGYKRWFLSGLLVGIGALAGAGVLVFAIFVVGCIPIICKGKIRREVVLYGVCFLLGIMAIMIPVMARNFVVGDDLVLITAHSGINFYIGNNSEANGTLKLPPFMRSSQKGVIEDAKMLAQQAMGKELKPSQVSRYWFSRSAQFIKTHPIKYAQLLLRKLLLFLNSHEIMDVGDYFLLKSYVPILNLPLVRFGVISPLSLWGMTVGLRCWRKNVLLYLFVIGYTLSVVIFFVNSRYRLPVVPLLLIFAAFGIYWWFEKIKTKRYKQATLALAPLATFVFLAHIPITGHDVVTPHYSLGIVYENKGWHEKAIEEYQKALQLYPHDAETHYALGNVYYKKGWFELSIEEYSEAVALNPYFVDAHYNLGLAYTEKGLNEKAFDEYEIVLALKPDDIDAHYNLGNLCKNNYMFDEALNHYAKVIELNPAISDAYYKAGEIFLYKELYEEAKDAFRKALEIDPRFTPARIKLKQLE